VSGILGNKSMPFYTTSKHGVVGLLKAASAELGASGIRINAVCLSPTYTGMMMEGGASIDQINQCEIAKMTVLGRVGKAREIGEMVRFLGSDAASYMTGGVHPIDGGMTAAGRKPI
jgi:NAD(P)-dependent dehydrogenase (short-subunit alcohol dehydrogenase family)